jgi:glycoside/pentoside/hexuronide:cation symporter, GPH family
MAISVAVAFFVIAHFGFHPAGHNSEHALLGLVGFFAVGPAVGHLISALLIVGLPIKDKPSGLTKLGVEESLKPIGDKAS